jgi:nucleoid DNA-binding protein
MVQILYKYLIINRQVTLPGIGVFHIQRQPAKHDYANKVFVSPALPINFNASTQLPDKRLYEFICRERGLNEVEAERKLNAFANKLNEQVRADKTVELPGMGLLKRDALGQISFEPANVIATYFPPTVAGNILEEKPQSAAPEKNLATASRETISSDQLAEGEVSQKSYWWVYAIILALLGIGAIGYYYYVNGSLK